MKIKKTFNDVWFPLLAFVGFFIVQVTVKPSEGFLTALAVILTLLIAILKTYRHEILVFIIGLILGLFIEVFLGLFARQQQWSNASLFGVPLWLPIVWGIGFVMITRIGVDIEGIKRKYS